ncbi:MAG: hypothetical protein HC899_21500, partial [Leptolyngbyaceae cyanobacterium SM1_4_3]|nr:hypothetical protein [Leptolyngbyaceae cyanobacterium SM1_4_3]
MENTSRKIILPGDPEFDLTLGLNLPPNWGQVAHQTWGQTACIARAESGLLEAVSGEELIEYLEVVSTISGWQRLTRMSLRVMSLKVGGDVAI